MSLVQFFRILWARRWIVVGATLACFLAALLASLLLPTRYTAQSRVMLDVVKPDPVTGQVIATTFARAYTKTQTELIRDYRVTGAVVDDLGWTRSPQLLARYNARSSDDRRDFRRWLAQGVSDATSATLIEGSNILEISYSTSSPEVARVVADAIRAAYIDQSLAFKRESAGKSADWFDRQVVKVRNQLAAAEQRKTAYERANNIVLQDDQSGTDEARLKALASSGATVAPALAAGASPAALQLAQLDGQIATAARALGPNHPELIDLRRRRAALAGAAAQERAAMGATTGGGPSLSSQVAAQQAKVMAQRDKIEALRQLQAEIMVLRDQFAKTAARAADLRQQAESNEAGLTLLGSAVAPQKPSFPNLPLILFGSLGLGLALGVLAALITELMSRRVRGVEDLMQTGVPVIVVIGGWHDPAPRPSLFERLKLRGPATA